MDINKLMEQAQAMQKKMERANEEIQNAEYVGEASNGLVKVVIDGNYKVKSVNIDESIINKEDKEMIQDLIMIAVNNASSELDKIKNQKYSSLTGGMKIPGM